VNEQYAPPNHHADYPGFKGVAGLVAALSMAFGRKGDAEVAVRLSGMGSGDSIVDVGCGPGVAVRYAARLGATVTGVDPAPVMLRTARLLTPRSTRVRYVKETAEDFPSQRVLLRSPGRSRSCTIGRTSTQGYVKFAECSSLEAVWSPRSGGSSQVPGDTGAMAGLRNRPWPLPINALTTAFPTFT